MFLTRTNDRFIAKLFEREVDEVRQGVVRLTPIAREPGRRTKVAVTSNDIAVDPVMACVGENGGRIHKKFVTDAVAPGDVRRVVIDEASHRIELVLRDDTLDAAIGKAGVNARLAGSRVGDSTFFGDEVREARDRRQSRRRAGDRSRRARPRFGRGVIQAGMARDRSGSVRGARATRRRRCGCAETRRGRAEARGAEAYGGALPAIRR